MSFVWKADRPLRTEEQVAREVHDVTLSRGLDEYASVLTLMGIRQESGFWCPWNRKDPSSEKYDHDSESDDGRSVAYLQQQNGRAGEVLPEGDRDNWWGPMSCRMNLQCSVNNFQDRLPGDYGTSLGNPAAASEMISRVQSPRPDLRGAYAKHYDYCWGLLHRALDGGVINPPAPPAVKPRPSIERNPAWRGDPIWLPTVLAAFGVDVSTYTDDEGIPWDKRGHGDFNQISWVLWHHTGNINETDKNIAHHPSLGLAANMLVHPDGHTVLTGVGVAWHGGVGIYPGIPEDGINQISIGIECAHSGAHGDPWPAVQMQAMINIGAAIEWFLGLPAFHEIAHKEWAGNENPLGINKQGKPDPVDIDMDWFRQQIAARAAQGPTGGEDDFMADEDIKQMIRDIHRETVTQSGPSRSFMADDGKNIDSPLGIEWNTDGNAWTLVMTEAYRLGVPLAVGVVEDIAQNGVAQTSWVGSNTFNAWLQEFGQAYCQGLVAEKAKE